MVQLTQAEKTFIQNLMDQEQNCIKKYSKSNELAKDNELKSLFSSFRQQEQSHYDSLNNLMQGNVQMISGQYEDVHYNPTPTYTGNFNQADKENDQFLATDSITSEKYVSSAYNNELFQFSDTNIRKLLNHIQTEEQQHAEKLWIYKTVNNMTN